MDRAHRSFWEFRVRAKPNTPQLEGPGPLPVPLRSKAQPKWTCLSRAQAELRAQPKWRTCPPKWRLRLPPPRAVAKQGTTQVEDLSSPCSSAAESTTQVEALPPRAQAQLRAQPNRRTCPFRAVAKQGTTQVEDLSSQVEAPPPSSPCRCEARHNPSGLVFPVLKRS